MPCLHVCSVTLVVGERGAAEPSRFSQKVPVEGPLPQLTRSSALPQSRHLNPQGSRALSPHLCGAALSSPVVSALPSCKALFSMESGSASRRGWRQMICPDGSPFFPSFCPPQHGRKGAFFHPEALTSSSCSRESCPSCSVLIGVHWEPELLRGLPVTRGCVWGGGRGGGGVCFPALPNRTPSGWFLQVPALEISISRESEHSFRHLWPQELTSVVYGWLEACSSQIQATTCFLPLLLQTLS